MSVQLLAAFIAACVLLALTPGPNMALIVANTLTGGLRGGLATVAGTTTGLALLVAAAVAGMGSVMVLMWAWFDVVRWLGAIYLVILGARQLWLLRRAPMAPLPGVAASPRGAYVQGLGVSLSNPKVILFLGAFLPQFVQGDSGLPQLLLLALVFVVVLALVDIACAVAVARVRTARHAVRHTRVLNGISGALLLLGGLALAVARRP